MLKKHAIEKLLKDTIELNQKVGFVLSGMTKQEFSEWSQRHRAQIAKIKWETAINSKIYVLKKILEVK